MVFLSTHLIVVFFQGLLTTIDGYWSFHYFEIPDLSILNLFRQNRYTEPYYIFSGTNTGYGFYGIKTSTEKYFKVTYLDSIDNILKTDRYFGLSTSNGISRLGTYASFLVNYIADTEKLDNLDTTFVQKAYDRIEFRKDYVMKSLKWLGKKTAKNIPHTYSYKVELMTIVPANVTQNPKTKPELYVVQEGLFRAE